MTRGVLVRQPGTVRLFASCRCALMFVASVWLLFSARTSWGGNGGEISLPQPSTLKLTSGLRLAVDAHAAEGLGYRAVRVTFSPMVGATFPTDRSIRIELRPNHWARGYSSRGAAAVVELVKGKSKAEQTILVPYQHTWSQMSVACFEDGNKLDDISIDNIGFISATSGGVGAPYPSFLIVAARAPTLASHPNASYAWTAEDKKRLGESHELPDVRPFVNQFVLPHVNTTINLSNPASDLETINAIQQHPNFMLAAFTDLPLRWQEHAASDVVVISSTDLISLIENESPRWAALRSWIEMGGNLFVYDAGESFSKLGQLEKAIAFLPAEPNARQTAWSAWNTPDPVKKPNQSEKSVSYFQTILRNNRNGNGWSPPNPPPTTQTPTTPEKTNTRPSPTRPATGSPPEFIWRELGLGLVIVVDSRDPFAQKDELYWAWLFDSLGEHRWLWEHRHGLSLTSPNEHFWNFLIPGVGRAPVGAFLFLISLFMIAIGPVNYFLLRRRGRLVLLLMTVPAGAMLVTMLLLLYAVLADGLGVRVRVRSYTEIDQRQQRCVSWSRQSYYAGVAPSRGLIFPSDAIVYPLESSPASNYDRGPDSMLEWTESSLQLSKGYFNSRTSTQFLVGRASATEKRLDVAPKNLQGTAPLAANQLGAEIESIVLRDAHGDYYLGGATRLGDAVRWEPVSEASARAQFTKWIDAHGPKFPEGYDSSFFSANNFRRRRPMYFGMSRQTYFGDMAAVSILEASLKKLTPSDQSPLPYRAYRAIVRKSPEVPIGTEAREEASFHVIGGRW